MVLKSQWLKNDREAAGFLLGKGGIHLWKYLLFLLRERFSVSVSRNRGRSYEEHKAAAARRAAAQVEAGQDIGEIPSVVDPARRAAALGSFQLFCETYFPDVFYLKWSPDHLQVIEKIEQVICKGGLFAMAMPRGFGKSTLCKLGLIFATLTGRHKFAVIVAASADKGKDVLDDVKIIFETNPLLLEDFPEVCYPIIKLGRVANRQKGQKYKGVHTRIHWGEKRIVLPTIEGSLASGAIIASAGMTGSEVRGLTKMSSGGDQLRPTLVFPDDPQTDDSALSPYRCRKRITLLNGAVLGMAGAGKKISGLLACTIIRPGDVADQITDRKKNPEWQGERRKLVYEFPTNTGLWDRYAEIRSESFCNGGDGSEATEYYVANREAMDAGAVVAWEERYDPGEVSALQHAINLKIRDPEVFASEYQNEPLVPELAEGQLSVDGIISKLNGYSRNMVPLACQWITSFIDVQDQLLFYVTCAWTEKFRGYVIDYGVFPDQKTKHFSLRKRAVYATLESELGMREPEPRWDAALDILIREIASREYPCDDGTVMHPALIMIDANYGPSTEVIDQHCRKSDYSAILKPYNGRYYGATSTPFHAVRKQIGDKIGHRWKIPVSKGSRSLRHVHVDTNYWKSFIAARLLCEPGDPGGMTLWGKDAMQHVLFAEHLTSEQQIKVEAVGRSVVEWKEKPDKPDNHWFDCIVGCAVGASMCGAVLPTVSGDAPKKTVQRVSFSELQRMAG